jgi:hypothetical protein
MFPRTESQKVLQAAQLRPHAARDPTPAVTINATRFFSGVEGSQGCCHGRPQAGLIIGGFRFDVTGGTKRIIGFLSGNSRIHGGSQCEEYYSQQEYPPGKTAAIETG